MGGEVRPSVRRKMRPSAGESVVGRPLVFLLQSYADVHWVNAPNTLAIRMQPKT